mmetsp:Transcript_5733/g.17639  ORF Transcript_5733/g.17639 Transcript_5733/m.17639 type:complete len:219 (+) Transcript_5733:1086-1742(+)
MARTMSLRIRTAILWPLRNAATPGWPPGAMVTRCSWRTWHQPDSRLCQRRSLNTSLCAKTGRGGRRCWRRSRRWACAAPERWAARRVMTAPGPTPWPRSPICEYLQIIRAGNRRAHSCLCLKSKASRRWPHRCGRAASGAACSTAHSINPSVRRRFATFAAANSGYCWRPMWQLAELMCSGWKLSSASIPRLLPPSTCTAWAGRAGRAPVALPSRYCA